MELRLVSEAKKKIASPARKNLPIDGELLDDLLENLGPGEYLEISISDLAKD